MSDQEIIDAIDAEIATINIVQTNYTRGYREEAGTISENDAYVDGLRFARALIVKRMEGGK